MNTEVNEHLTTKRCPHRDCFEPELILILAHWHMGYMFMWKKCILYIKPKLNGIEFWLMGLFQSILFHFKISIGIPITIEVIYIYIYIYICFPFCHLLNGSPLLNLNPTIYFFSTNLFSQSPFPFLLLPHKQIITKRVF